MSPPVAPQPEGYRNALLFLDYAYRARAMPPASNSGPSPQLAAQGVKSMPSSKKDATAGKSATKTSPSRSQGSAPKATAATKAPDDHGEAAKLIWDSYYGNHQKNKAY